MEVEAAERAAEAKGALAEEICRAGWLQYLVRSDSERALALFRQGSARSGVARGCHLGLGELARDRLDEAGALEGFVTAATADGGPELPAEAAVLRLGELSGLAPAQLDAAAASLQAALSRGKIAGQAAWRAREWLAFRREAAGDGESAAVLRRAAGTLQRFTVVGPFSAYRLLEFDRAFAPEEAVDLAERYSTPVGEVVPRAFEFPDGRLALDGHDGRGDVFYAAADLRVEQGGPFLLRTEGPGALAVFVDGARVYRRVPYPRPAPRGDWSPLELAPGPHRVLVKWSGAGGASEVRVAFAPGSAAASPHPRDLVALYRSALAVADDDPELSADLADALLERAPRSAPALALRAELARASPHLPEPVARGRALRDLEAAAAADEAMLRVRLQLAALARESGRWEDAERELDEVERRAPKAPLLWLSRAHLALRRGFVAGAARALGAVDPGRCDARELWLELASREDAAEALDRTASAFARCPGGRERHARHLQERGDVSAALELQRAMAGAAPDRAGPRLGLADALVAAGRPEAAAEEVKKLVASWPRNAALHKRLADLYEHAGDLEGARAARLRALEAGGADVLLRRALALEEGREPLDWARADGIEAISAYRREGGGVPAEGAPAVIVRDAAGMEAYPGGAVLERVHTIAQVIDPRGVERFGEVQLPGDAEVLTLRTVKADGTVLEPESIAEKEAVSMPGLEPGDFVEYEYLRGEPPRGPQLPGWTGSTFHFRTDETPLHETVLEARAAPGVALEVDARLGEPAPPVERAPDGSSRWKYRRTGVAPWVTEAHAPAETEFLPWAQVGAGAGAGPDPLGAATADWALLKARPTREVRRLAAGALAVLPADASELERVRAVYRAVAEAVRGNERGAAFDDTASAAVARGRGDRTLALKAALEAAGVPARLALVRPFDADPWPFRFPHHEVYRYALVRAEPRGGGPVWLDAGWRHAAMGVLMPQVRGQEALLLPEPGGRAERARAPDAGPVPDEHRVELDLTLGEDGAVAGTGRETFRGFDAAFARERLETTSEPQRKQALETQLQRAFRNAELLEHAVEESAEAASPLAIRTRFRAAGWGVAGDEPGALRLPGRIFSLRLGPRYVQRASRTSPLLVAQPERVTVRARIALPEGHRPRGDAFQAEIASPFGSFVATRNEEGGALVVEELFELRMQRVPPEDYAAFAEFCQAVDRAQEWVLWLARSAPVSPGSKEGSWSARSSW